MFVYPTQRVPPKIWLQSGNKALVCTVGEKDVSKEVLASTPQQETNPCALSAMEIRSYTIAIHCYHNHPKQESGQYGPTAMVAGILKFASKSHHMIDL